MLAREQSPDVGISEDQDFVGSSISSFGMS
jgi:hypothetical protein